MACMDACHVRAISKRYDGERHLTYKLDEDRCIHCGKCEKVCPLVSGMKYGENNIKHSQLYAGWCADISLRMNSSSGGIFAALAKAVIKDGGIAIGASLNGFEVRHIAISETGDIPKMQGSKYTQSDTAGIYRMVIDYLKQGKNVLFSGLGCQVAGLLGFLGERFDKSSLLTVDLICGGVPSKFLIEQFERENNDKYSSIHAFRNKQRYEFSVVNRHQGIDVIPNTEKPLPLSGFYTELTNRYSCYDCQFAYAHRKSDITIGDFWGDDKFPEQHKDGISAIVVHSEKGEAWLAKAPIEKYEASWQTFLTHNHRMVDGSNSAGKTKARKKLAKAIANYDRFSFLCTYANYATIKRPWSWVKKVWRYAIGRMMHNAHLDKVNKILSQQ